MCASCNSASVTTLGPARPSASRNSPSVRGISMPDLRTADSQLHGMRHLDPNSEISARPSFQSCLLKSEYFAWIELCLEFPSAF